MQISRALCVAALCSLLTMSRAAATEEFEQRATAMWQNARDTRSASAFNVAEHEIRQLLEAHPTSGALHLRLAQCYLAEMNFVDGQPELLTAVHLQPDLAEAWEVLAILYYKEGRLYDAETALRKLCDADPAALTEPRRATAIANLRAQIESELKIAPPPMESDLEYANQADYLAYAIRPGAIFWNRDAMPLKVWINTNCSVPGWQLKYVESVKDAFQAWTALVPARLRVTYVDQKEKADIVWDWSDDESKFPNAGESVATILTSGNGELKHADVLLRLHVPHAPLNERTQDTLALHAAGHIFGLQAHSPNPRDLMFGAVSTSHIHGLTARDKNTFKRLYSDDAMVKEASKRDPIATMSLLRTHQTTREGKVLDYLAQGSEHMQKGEWQQAVQCFEQAKQLDPDDAVVLNDLGSANIRHAIELANNGEIDSALVCFDQATQAFTLAGNHERVNVVKDVRSRAEKSALPKPYLALLQKGRDEARAGSFEAAVNTLSEAIKLSPEHAGAWCLRSQCYLELKKTSAALADSLQALKLEPTDSQTLRVRGLVAEQQNDDDAALKFLRDAVAAGPAGQDVYLDLGALLTRQRKWNEVVDTLTEGISKHPKCGGCYGGRALAKLAMNDRERAISDMQMALALEPNNAALWFNMGAMDAQRDQYDSAIADFTKAISLKPADPDAYRSRALVYQLTKQLDKAHEDEAAANKFARKDSALFHVNVGEASAFKTK